MRTLKLPSCVVIVSSETFHIGKGDSPGCSTRSPSKRRLASSGVHWENGSTPVALMPFTTA